MTTNRTLIDFWDSHWAKRDIGDTGLMLNTKKANYLINLLWSKFKYIPLKKLDIGCGPCFHIKVLSQLCREWGENYTGIDMCPTAVSIANRWGINAQIADIYNFESDERFELFLLLDVLEHIEDHDRTAENIKRLSTENFWIFGNVPLYLSDHSENGGFERPIGINNISRFLNACGLKDFYHEIYGIDGYPYMMFEGNK